MDPTKLQLLNQFIPKAALVRMAQRFRFWHQESRMMTVLFINLDFQEFHKLENQKFQDIFSHIQKHLYRYEGSLNKFMYDDKGATAIAVFGLPPMCNFDDAARGVYAALKIRDYLTHDIGIKTSIGITAGRVYCGLLGSPGSGGEYGILGDLVNLAARLMQHGKKPKNQG